MAYRVVAVVLLLGVTARAEPKQAPVVALVIEGANEERVQLAQALGKALDVKSQTSDVQVDDTRAQGLRVQLGADRVVVVTLSRQGKSRWHVKVRAVDDSGVTHRFGDALGISLTEDVLKVIEQLPALPQPPPPAKAPEPPPPAPAAKEEPPPEKDEKPAPVAADKPRVYKKRHPYAMLVAGLVAFAVPYFATVGLAAHYQPYNANAARGGYVPLVGPFLGRNALSDKDLNDGFDPGLIAMGVVQILTFNVLVAGIIWCAVGEKHEVKKEHARVLPLFGVDGRSASLGARVTW
jgi:hypothetical protein